MLPGEAEEEPRQIRHATTMPQPTVLAEDRQLVHEQSLHTCRPDDGVDLDLAAVFQANRAVGVDDAV